MPFFYLANLFGTACIRFHETAHFENHTQLLEYQNIFFIRDIWFVKTLI